MRVADGQAHTDIVHGAGTCGHKSAEDDLPGEVDLHVNHSDTSDTADHERNDKRQCYNGTIPLDSSARDFECPHTYIGVSLKSGRGRDELVRTTIMHKTEGRAPDGSFDGYSERHGIVMSLEPGSPIHRLICLELNSHPSLMAETGVQRVTP